MLKKAVPLLSIEGIAISIIFINNVINTIKKPLDFSRGFMANKTIVEES